MTILVSIYTKTGKLRRYESGGEAVRATHVAIPEDGPNILTPILVENFRTYPPSEFAIEPPRIPPHLTLVPTDPKK